MANAYIIDAARTPRGKRAGSLAGIHPVDLGTIPLKTVIERNGLNAEVVDDVVYGCVSQRGEQDDLLTRKIVLAAGLPETVPGVVLNRFCGSGLTACNWAAESVMSGMQQVVVAGGVESMTRVPMEINFVGEESNFTKNYPNLVPQGMAAEMVAQKYGYNRSRLDTYAARSQTLSAQAWEEGRFKKSIVPVDFETLSGTRVQLARDEHMRPGTTVESLAKLKPVFLEDGVIHAGNSSGIVDGAAAVLIASDSAVKANKLTPRARVVATAVVGSEPVIMLTGPVPATQKALKIAGLKVSDIDLFEVNEAFAPVPLMFAEELGVPLEKINVNGGAIAMGHPLGATGAMLVGTVLDELERQNLRYGCVTLCIGFGMGITLILDRKI